ncbi:shikimate kinase [Micropruina sonneratiae]|uniref:shikimate kinase n=1 Tax=Micropruina sonneratiae TaxID=2986940 RepID=UPI00222690A7|nr:shikimate kinase [Micropruina sp. KQZ13P-5]MCW3157731.1 shikimate kinase [Micropruina sp. KQZ13P-5]
MTGATIALIGAPGAGKTSVGRQLAARLELPFVDVDARIEAEQGKLVREIFADSGEAHFRELERVATLAALSEPGVVSLGGGAVMTPGIAEAVAGVFTVWLQVSVTQASRRVGLNQARPLLLGNLRATLIKLLAERTPVYENLATITVDTDRSGVRGVVEQIVAQWEGVDR